MMDNMVVDDVVEEVSAKKSATPVDRAYSTFGVGPCSIGIVRYFRVRMVEICNGH